MSMPVLPIKGKPHTAKLTLLARLVLSGTESEGGYMAKPP
jgi:hypothetical protein